jgi:hypothetical protein
MHDEQDAQLFRHTDRYESLLGSRIVCEKQSVGIDNCGDGLFEPRARAVRCRRAGPTRTGCAAGRRCPRSRAA